MKRNTRWYLLAVIAGALQAGAALWAAQAFLTAPVAVLTYKPLKRNWLGEDHAK